MNGSSEVQYSTFSATRYRFSNLKPENRKSAKPLLPNLHLSLQFITLFGSWLEVSELLRNARFHLGADGALGKRESGANIDSIFAARHASSYTWQTVIENDVCGMQHSTTTKLGRFCRVGGTLTADASRWIIENCFPL